MALLHPFAGTEAKAKEPINESLMDLKYKENIEDLAAQIDAIPSGGVVGSGSTLGEIGSIDIGGETNEPVFWKRKFSVLENMLSSDASNPSGFDPEGINIRNELLTFTQGLDGGVTTAANANAYLGRVVIVDEGSEISFRIKKGINFFGMCMTTSVGTPDSLTVTIDGQSLTALNIEDENGNARTDTFSTTSAATKFQVPFFFYGLDGEEHIVTVLNTDSASKTLQIDAIEVGYRSNDYTLNEIISIKKGTASVRGSSIEFDETDFTIGKTEASGHTASLVADTSGVLSILDGECPAMTQVKPEESIDFTSPVTTLPVKNTLDFPDNGICLMSTPYGDHHLFSYTSKTDLIVQSHSLDDLQWQSTPSVSITPLDGFDSTSVGEAVGDLNINYWGTAPILIDSTNNKLDFSISIAGITSIHVCTIPSGRYSADLVPLEKAIRDQMNAVKPIRGDYRIKYNSDLQLWNIYVEDVEVEAFSLLFNTGLNAANSVHTTLGFGNGDLTGSLSYLATTVKIHLSCRALEAEAAYIHSEDPRIKYSAPDVDVLSTRDHDIEERLDLGAVRVLGPGARMIQIYTDKECAGLELNFVCDDNDHTMTFQIDDGNCLYLLTPGNVRISDANPRGKIKTAYITFPRGSRKITIRNETSARFAAIDAPEYIHFAGARQYFTKPCYEKLTKVQAVIRTFEVSPRSVYATTYSGNSSLLYSPGASDDNINSIFESSPFVAAGLTSIYNSSRRVMTALNQYMEVNFTLQGDGGGIGLKSIMFTNASKKGQLFISTGVINEATDLIQNTAFDWSATNFDQEFIQLLGLKAGTYTVRIKCASAAVNGIGYSGITVYDSVSPQENANTVSDLTNNGQSISYPINVVRDGIAQDSGDRIPVWLQRSGYKEGRTSLVNYAVTNPAWINYDDVTQVIERHGYYNSRLVESSANSFVQLGVFCKSISLVEQTFSNLTTLNRSRINGQIFLNTHSQRECVKGGNAPTATRGSFVNLTAKEFKLSCTFSAGDTFNVSDTRGLKVNTPVLLDDGTNKETVVIASIIIGASFTVKKARTSVIDANVAGVEFQGFHSYSMITGDAVSYELSNFEYEPMKVTPSKALSRKNSLVYEKVSVTVRLISNGESAYYPMHSDGIAGTWSSSTVQIIGQSDGSGAYTLPQNLKNIEVAAGTIDIKITSERLVPTPETSEKF